MQSIVGYWKRQWEKSREPFTTQHKFMRYLPFRGGAMLLVGLSPLIVTREPIPIIVVLFGCYVVFFGSLKNYARSKSRHDDLRVRHGDPYLSYFNKMVERGELPSMIATGFAAVKPPFE